MNMRTNRQICSPTGSTVQLSNSDDPHPECERLRFLESHAMPEYEEVEQFVENPGRIVSECASKIRERNENENAQRSDIQSLIEACQLQKRSAQEQIYHIFHRDVYRLMVRMIGLQDAEDLLQQVFLQTFRKIDQFSGRSSFKTWLYRLAVNEGLQYLRRKSRQSLRGLQIEPVDHRPNHARATAEKDLLETALRRLDPELRSIFLLRESQKMTYKEISEILEIAEGTVASRLSHARRDLKRILADLGWKP